MSCPADAVEPYGKAPRAWRKGRHLIYSILPRGNLFKAATWVPGSFAASRPSQPVAVTGEDETGQEVALEKPKMVVTHCRMLSLGCGCGGACKARSPRSMQTESI
jgi:hypothetical protein